METSPEAQPVTATDSPVARNSDDDGAWQPSELVPQPHGGALARGGPGRGAPSLETLRRRVALVGGEALPELLERAIDEAHDDDRGWKERDAARRFVLEAWARAIERKTPFQPIRAGRVQIANVTLPEKGTSSEVSE